MGVDAETDRHRGRRPVVRRVVADRAGTSARCAASSTRCRSSRSAFIGLEIFGSLFYEQVFHLERARPRLRLRARRAAQLIGLLLGDPHRHAAVRAERDARSRASSPASALVVAVAWTAFALSPEPRHRGRSLNAIVDRDRRADRPADLRRAVARDPAEDPLVRLRDRRALDPARPDPAADRRRARRRVGHPHRARCSMVPIFLIGALVVASAGKEIEKRHQAGCGPRPPRSPRCCTSAARAASKLLLVPRRQRRTTATCRCCSTSTSRSTRARSSRCSARTAPASRRC